MPNNNPVTNKSVQFPPQDLEGETKLSRFLKTLEEFMEVKLEITKVTIMQVKVLDERPDVMTVLNKVVVNEKRKINQNNSKSSQKT